MTNLIDRLYSDCILHIAQYLYAPEVARCQRISRLFHHPNVWLSCTIAVTDLPLLISSTRKEIHNRLKRIVDHRGFADSIHEWLWICTQFPNLEVIDAEIYFSDFHTWASHVPRTRLPMLEHLRIRFPANMSSQHLPAWMTAKGSCVNLKRLDIVQITLGTDLASLLCVSCPLLEDLSTDTVSIDNSVCFTRLKRLSVRTVLSRTGQADVTVAFPVLDHLIVRRLPQSFFTTISIHMPCLDKLTLSRESSEHLIYSELSSVHSPLSTIHSLCMTASVHQGAHVLTFLSSLRSAHLSLSGFDYHRRSEYYDSIGSIVESIQRQSNLEHLTLHVGTQTAQLMAYSLLAGITVCRLRSLTINLDARLSLLVLILTVPCCLHTLKELRVDYCYHEQPSNIDSSDSDMDVESDSDSDSEESVFDVNTQSERCPPLDVIIIHCSTRYVRAQEREMIAVWMLCRFQHLTRLECYNVQPDMTFHNRFVAEYRQIYTGKLITEQRRNQRRNDCLYCCGSYGVLSE
jgi:hypothetical protein